MGCMNVKLSAWFAGIIYLVYDIKSVEWENVKL